MSAKDFPIPNLLQQEPDRRSLWDKTVEIDKATETNSNFDLEIQNAYE